MSSHAYVNCGVAGALIVVMLLAVGAVNGFKSAGAAEPGSHSKLLVIWSSADRDVAIKMVYMYSYNAKKNGWWDEVRFVVWGPSAKLLSEDAELQDYLKKMKDEGVVLEACKACSDMYGVSEKLAAMGIDVKYMGKPLTGMLKSGEYVSLTF